MYIFNSKIILSKNRHCNINFLSLNFCLLWANGWCRFISIGSHLNTLTINWKPMHCKNTWQNCGTKRKLVLSNYFCYFCWCYVVNIYSGTTFESTFVERFSVLYYCFTLHDSCGNLALDLFHQRWQKSSM